MSRLPWSMTAAAGGVVLDCPSFSFSLSLTHSLTHLLVQNELLSQNLIPTVLVLPFVTPLETQTQEQVIRPHEQLGIPQRAFLGCLEGFGGTTEADMVLLSHTDLV